MVTKSKDLTHYVWRKFGQTGGAWYGDCDQYPVCAAAWTSVSGEVDVEAAFPISVSPLMSEWKADDMTVNRVEFMAFAYNSGLSQGHTYVDWYADGYTKKGGEKVTFPGTWGKVSQLISLPIVSLRTPLYTDFTIGFHLIAATSAGSTTLALGNPTLYFDVSTTFPTSPVKIQVFGPDKVSPWEGVSVVVTGPERGAALTDYNGEVNFDLFDGTYHLKATKKVDDTTYIHELNFTVPQDLYVPVTLEQAGFQLPWWWWIVPVSIGGVIVTWALVRTFAPRKREAPPIYVVR